MYAKLKSCVMSAMASRSSSGNSIFFVVLQLGLPKLAVGHALLEVGIWEKVQPVETRWPFLSLSVPFVVVTLWATYRNARIKTFQMVGAPHNEDSIIALEPIDPVQEVAANLIRQKRVQILKDQVARRRLPRQRGDRTDGRLRASPLLVPLRKHILKTNPPQPGRPTDEKFRTYNVGIGSFCVYSVCIIALIEIVFPFPGGP
jgi:hypothetical protein